MTRARRRPAPRPACKSPTGAPRASDANAGRARARLSLLPALALLLGLLAAHPALGQIATPHIHHLIPGNESVVVAWHGDANADHAEVQYRPTGTTRPQTITSTSEFGQAVRGLTNGTSYEFRVQERDSSGTHAASAWTAWSAATPDVPPTLGAVTATPGPGKVELTWQTPDWGAWPAAGFAVLWRPSERDAHGTSFSGTRYYVPELLPATATSYTFTGENLRSNNFLPVTDGTAYDLKVVAFTRRADAPTRTTDVRYFLQDEVVVGGKPNDPLWSATLKVDAASGFLGCDDNDDSHDNCSVALSDTDFEFEGTTYTVEGVYVDTSAGLSVDLNKAVPDGGPLVLRVGSAAPHILSTADATVGDTNGEVTDGQWDWTSTGLSWSDGESVSLSLEDAGATGFVSNVGQTSGGHVSLYEYSYAQAFTTGWWNEGYGLDSVEVRLRTTSSLTAANIGTVKAQIWSDSSGAPGSKFKDLLVPTAIAAGEDDVTVTLEAPDGTNLDAYTTYHVVLYSTGQLQHLAWRHTDSDAQDAGAGAGWSIADAASRKNADLPTATNKQWVTNAKAFTLAVNGHAKPPAPANLGVAGGDGSLDLSWTEPSGTVTGYDVHYTYAPDSGQNAVGDDAAAGTDASAAWLAIPRTRARAEEQIAGLTNGREHRVRVRAKNPGGAGAWAHGTGTPSKAPTVPRDVAVARGDGKLTLTWDGPTSWGSQGEAAGYFVVEWRSDAISGSSWDERVRVNDMSVSLQPGDTSVEFTGVQRYNAVTQQHTVASGTAYRLRIRASSEVSGPDPDLHSDWVEVMGTTPPAEVTGLRTLPFPGAAQLEWTAPTGTVTGYDVHYTSAAAGSVGNEDEVSGGSDAAAGWVDAEHPDDVNGLDVTGLVNGAAYRFRVRAKNDGGSGPWAFAASTPAVLVAPTPVTVTPGDRKLDLSWPAQHRRYVYEVEYTSASAASVGNGDARGTDPATGWFHHSATSTNPGQRTITSLHNGTEYRVRVRAAYDAYDAPWAFGKGTPMATPPGVATALATNVGHKRLDVSWTASAIGDPPDGYDVHYTASTTAGDEDALGSDSATGWADAGHTGTAASHAITGLKNDTAYRWRVRGKNSGGEAPWAFGTGTPRRILGWFGVSEAIGEDDGYAEDAVIRLTEAPPTATTVEIVADTSGIGSPATEGVDYTVSPKTVTFAAGQTQAVVALTPLWDFDDSEGEESARLRLRAPSDAPYLIRDLEDPHYLYAVLEVVVFDAAPPGAPENLVLTPGDGRLDATWTPTPGGPDGYDVHYRRVGGGWTDANHAGTAAEHAITGLTNRAGYEVRVRWAHGAKRGAWATARGIPQAQPQSLTLTTDGEPAEGGPAVVLTARLAAPALEARTLFIDAAGTARSGLRFFAANCAGIDWTSRPIQGVGERRHQIVLEIRKGWRQATARLTVCDDDEEDPAETIELSTEVEGTWGEGADLVPDLAAALTLTIRDNDALPEAPADLAVLPGPARLELGWTAPANTPVTGYHVHYTSATQAYLDRESSGTGSDPATHWVDAGHAGTAAGHVVAGLADGTAYRVRVRAHNADGDGHWAHGAGTPGCGDARAVGCIETVAGTGTAGYGGDGGPATGAQLNGVYGVAADASGNLLLAGWNSHRVRRTDAGGTIATVAGTGVAGFAGDGGAATAARLDGPYHAVADGAGNLYVADTRNHRVRRVDAADGTIATIAGTGTAGYGGDGGAATAAQLNNPVRLALDGAGNLYVADSGNHRVRRVDAADGTVSTVAGTGDPGSAGDGGAATAAQLFAPYGLAVDGAGNLFIADTFNHRVRRVDAASGNIATVAGTGISGFGGDGGAATAAQLDGPHDVAVDTAGNLYVADATNHRVRRVAAADGTIATVAGTGDQGFGGDGAAATAAKLDGPVGLALDTTGGLRIADVGNHRVRRVGTATGAAALPAAGPPAPSGPAAPAFFPADGDTTADPGTDITLTFAEAVYKDASGAAFGGHDDLAAILTLKRTGANGADIAYAARIDATNTVVTIDPDADLADGAVYAAVSADYHDADGVRGAAADATFTVAAPAVIPTVTLSATTPVDEGSPVTVTATLSSALAGDVTIPLTITDDTAEPEDHGALASITVPANALSGTGEIATAHDPGTDNETFTVALDTANLPSTVAAGTPSSVRVAIDDDDDAATIPSVSLSASPNPVREGSSVTVTATLTSAITRAVTIPVTLTDGTSESGDYGSLTGIRIGANRTSGTGPIAARHDADPDDETFTVAIDAANLPATVTAGSPASVEIGIDDDDTPRVTLSATSRVDEGDSATVTARLSAPAPAGGATVPLTITDGTAEPADHGTLASIAIAGGERSGTGEIPTRHDDDTDDETFTVAVDAANLDAALAAGSPSSARVTIRDDDAAVTLSASPNPVAEGRGVRITARLNRSLAADVEVPLTLTRGTAESGDYGSLASIAIRAGRTSATGDVTTAQDDDTDSETFTVALGALPANLKAGATTSVEVTIEDDDATVSLSASPNPVPEGESVTVTATLSGAASRTVTIPLTVTDGTSEAADRGTLSSIRISSGRTSGTGRISTRQDDDSDDETFTVAVDTARLPATVTAGSPTSVEITIDDDDTPTVSLRVEPRRLTEGESATVTLTLSGALAADAAIPLKVTPDEPFGPESGDYALPDITIAAGATKATGALTTTRDVDSEDERFRVELGDLPPEVAKGRLSWARVSILERGRTTVTLSAPAQVNEGESATITATLDPPLAFPATVPVEADIAGDRSKIGTLTGIAVAAGARSGTGTITTAQDDDDRDDTFWVQLGETFPERWTLGNPYSVRVRIVDDDRPASGTGTSAWLLPSSADPARRGTVRVANRSGAAGEAVLTATDDAGRTYPPVTVALGARAAAELDAADLEAGSAAKGLAGGTGPGAGDWRLEVASVLEVEATAYAKAADGFAAPLDAVVPARADGTLGVALFNPAADLEHRSLLRLVNPGDTDARATVTGVDDAGRPGLAAVRLAVPAGAACTVDAAQLETGTGLACGAAQPGLGDGSGRWRLTIRPEESPLIAMNLLAGADGRLANLSAPALPDADGAVRVPLFPAASDPAGRQGVVRIVNRSERAGTVRIHAADDGAAAYAPLALALGPGQAVDLDADDLELGSRAKGLTGSTGAGTGAWRLALAGDVDFEARAYVRARDGFLTAVRPARPVAPEAPRAQRLALPDPARGVLRLANPGPEAAAVLVTGVDDRGVGSGMPVRVVVPAGGTVELTAAELESGDAEAIVSGALGDGAGGWRLTLDADAEVAAASLLAGPGGHLADVSGADAAEGRREHRQADPEDAERLRDR